MQINEAFDRIGHALGNPDGATLVGNLRVLNDAGRYFYSMHPWRFARRVTALVTIPAGAQYLTLPLGVASITDLSATTAFSGVVSRTDPARMAQLVASGLTGTGGVLYWSEVYVGPSDANGVLRKLEIFPEQDTATVNGLSLAYRCDWTKIDNDIDSVTSLPIPDFAEPLFGALLECFALGMERPEQGSVSQRVAGLVPLMDVAFGADSRSTLDYSPVRNSALQMANANRRRDELIWDTGSVRLPIL